MALTGQKIKGKESKEGSGDEPCAQKKWRRFEQKPVTGVRCMTERKGDFGGKQTPVSQRMAKKHLKMSMFGKS